MKIHLLAAAFVLAAGPALADPPFIDANDAIASIGTNSFFRMAGDAGDASSVRVVRLSSLLGGASQAQRLAAVRAQKARAIDYLQGQLAFNQPAAFAIRNSGFDLGDIVAVTIDGRGAAVVYADDL